MQHASDHDFEKDVSGGNSAVLVKVIAGVLICTALVLIGKTLGLF